MSTRLKTYRVVSLALAATCCVAGSVAQEPKDERKQNTHFEFVIRHERTLRDNDTTQIHISYDRWANNTFCLWFPELVDPLWVQWDSEVGRQEFERTRKGGLKWTFRSRLGGRIKAELTPHDRSIVLETSVVNDTSTEIRDIYAQNCLHFPDAPDFACDDFSRVFVRVDGQWRSLASLKPSSGVPVYYRKGYPKEERRGYMSQFQQDI